VKDLRGLEAWRLRGRPALEIFGTEGDDRCGVFAVGSPIDRQKMLIVVSGYDGWDHVSVSRKNRPPNWTEMDHVFRLFFAPDETAMQLHVPSTEHVNVHPHVLHIWRPHDTPIPKPPKVFV